MFTKLSDTNKAPGALQKYLHMAGKRKGPGAKLGSSDTNRGCTRASSIASAAASHMSGLGNSSW